MVRSTPIAAVAGLGLLIAGMLLSTLAGSNNVGFVIGSWPRSALGACC
jgi:hypothetical protein